eukprot:1182000-Prorocentrum_minimum.AAC.1
MPPHWRPSAARWIVPTVAPRDDPSVTMPPGPSPRWPSPPPQCLRSLSCLFPPGDGHHGDRGGLRLQPLRHPVGPGVAPAPPRRRIAPRRSIRRCRIAVPRLGRAAAPRRPPGPEQPLTGNLVTRLPNGTSLFRTSQVNVRDKGFRVDGKGSRVD